MVGGGHGYNRGLYGGSSGWGWGSWFPYGDSWGWPLYNVVEVAPPVVRSGCYVDEDCPLGYSCSPWGQCVA